MPAGCSPRTSTTWTPPAAGSARTRSWSGCSRRPGEALPVSPLLAAAVAAALRAAEETDGDLDPTVGSALVALGYDRDFAQLPVDGPGPGWTVHRAPGWRDVDLDERSGRMTLPAGVVLDLGATAKAWQADRSAARIASELGAACW